MGDESRLVSCAVCDRLSTVTVTELRDDAGAIPGGFVPLPLPTPDLADGFGLDADRDRYEFDDERIVCHDCAVTRFPGALDQYRDEPVVALHDAADRLDSEGRATEAADLRRAADEWTTGE